MSAAPTTQTGYVNCNGQVTIRNTDQPGNDHLQYTYQVACFHCGYTTARTAATFTSVSALGAKVGKPGFSWAKVRA